MIVVLGDADDGTRLLAALDAATRGTTPPQIIVNDAIRERPAGDPGVDSRVPRSVSGVAPIASSVGRGRPEGFFAANAVDCVNLIALAAIQAESDDSRRDPEEHGGGQRRRAARA